MTLRPPSRRRPRTDTQREQWRLAKQRQRAREGDGTKRASIYYGKTVIEALIVQSIDAGHSEEEASKQSRDRKKVAADLADVIETWARTYITERAKRHA